MLRWLPSAAERVEKSAHDDFYPRLFRQLVTFLTNDAKWRRQSLTQQETN
jgi:TorA maturation chaperone TorD